MNPATLTVPTAAEELGRRCHALERLLAVTRTLAEEVDTDRIMPLAIREACRALDCERASLYAFDEVTKDLQILHGIMGGIGCFLLAGVGRTFAVLNSTFCINSVCHLWGRQPHGTSDSSRDSWLVSLVTFGEGYHNYHHMYPTDYRNGHRWYHFDPSKWLILGLYTLGLATSLRTGSYVEDSLTRTT